MALRDQKPRMFCTYWDVVSMCHNISTEKIDISDQVPELSQVIRRKAEIETAIIQVDSIIRAKLSGIYSEAQLQGASTAAFVTAPVADRRNSGDTELLSVLLNNSSLDIYTAAWILSFTSPTLYNVYSSLEATQGTGWLVGDATNTSTNGEITIEDGFWFANNADFVAGDRFYFSVVRAHPIIWTISVHLATGHALSSIFSTETPNESAYGKLLWDKGMKLLEALMKREANLDGTTGNWDLTTIAIDYNINSLGYDVSSYLLDRQGGSQLYPDLR